ncbi:MULTISPECIES: SIR2 family protein [unclassified Bosea (in: a-proteobacteria)]|uniref:SIR2 family protein n=1 Tax=unclassified Bosea (in: a-proteobacteria) TaxID=2653178 RepID=UPI0009666ECB|nr:MULTISPECIES: SIR2 family protein [unclassified Bosea (in: a-proteobacteria)]OJV10626.1 MAG: SIR2 family protein [Bosea sp. 67-29]
MSEGVGSRRFQFLRNGNADPDSLDWDTGIETARQAISEALNAKNVAFLLGAGCSSLVKGGIEFGIPTMAPLARKFCEEAAKARPSDVPENGPAVEGGLAADTLDPNEDLLGTSEEPSVAPMTAPKWRPTSEELSVLDKLGVDLSRDFSRNLERLMEVLFAQRFVLRLSDHKNHAEILVHLEGLIRKVQDFLWDHVTTGRFTDGDTSVRDVYEKFYRKLVLRDRALPRPWVFTTNYDHFNEVAMDRLGIPYANGFSGVIERRFNPASFRYALAEQLDLANRKWSAVDAFVYLAKLHGSVTWTEDDHGLFPIREVWPPGDAGRMLIYPTPAKQNSSLGSPYADLFREFQGRIVREQSILFTAGYAFADEHLNNIIYQALTIPTFRLIIFASPDSEGEIAKLRALQDPRIWIIGGDGPVDETWAHYFDVIVEHFMPQRPGDRIDDAVRKVLSDLAPRKKDQSE